MSIAVAATLPNAYARAESSACVHTTGLEIHLSGSILEDAAAIQLLQSRLAEPFLRKTIVPPIREEERGEVCGARVGHPVQQLTNSRHMQLARGYVRSECSSRRSWRRPWLCNSSSSNSLIFLKKEDRDTRTTTKGSGESERRGDKTLYNEAVERVGVHCRRLLGWLLVVRWCMVGQEGGGCCNRCNEEDVDAAAIYTKVLPLLFFTHTLPSLFLSSRSCS